MSSSSQHTVEKSLQSQISALQIQYPPPPPPIQQDCPIKSQNREQSHYPPELYRSLSACESYHNSQYYKGSNPTQIASLIDANFQKSSSQDDIQPITHQNKIYQQQNLGQFEPASNSQLSSPFKVNSCQQNSANNFNQNLANSQMYFANSPPANNVANYSGQSPFALQQQQQQQQSAGSMAFIQNSSSVNKANNSNFVNSTPLRYQQGNSATSSEYNLNLDQLLIKQPSLARNLSLGHLSCGSVFQDRLNHSCGQIQLPLLFNSSPYKGDQGEESENADYSNTCNQEKRQHRHSIDLSALMRQLARNSSYKKFQPRQNTSFEMLQQQHTTPTTTMAGISSLAAATSSQNQRSQEQVFGDRENLVFSPTLQSQEYKQGQRFSTIGLVSVNQSYQPTTSACNQKNGACYSQLQPADNLFLLQQSHPHTFFIKKEPIWQINENLIQKNYPIHLNLQFFKTHQCHINYQHNHKHCPFYHSSKDQRRPVNKFKYQHELCKFSDEQFAEQFNSSSLPFSISPQYQFTNNSQFVLPNSFGQSPSQPQHSHLTCNFSHNRVQRLYHPDKYKTKFCTYYPNQLYKCQYQDFCCFAHSQADIKVPLLHNMQKDADFYLFYFKTAWCPFTHQHNKAQCVYAHNWQDFRRKPNLFLYSSNMCPNWKSGTFIMTYQEGCVFQWRCEYCHGWKQKQFHPMNYKTFPCPYKKQGKNCSQKGIDSNYDECPYYHQNQGDYRLVNSQQMLPKKRDDILWEKDRILWTNNINDMREKFINENENIQRNLNQPSAAINDTTTVYNRRSLLSENLSDLQQTVKQRIKYQRRLSLDFTERDIAKYSDYFKLFKGDKNLLYFNLGEKTEKQELKEKQDVEGNDKIGNPYFEKQMSSYQQHQVDNTFESQGQNINQKPQFTPEKEAAGCFAGFSPLISGTKPYRKLSFDIFGLDSFELTPSSVKGEKDLKNKSLIELEDSDVEDLLNQSNRAGKNLQSSSSSQSLHSQQPQFQEQFKQQLQQQTQTTNIK